MNLVALDDRFTQTYLYGNEGFFVDVVIINNPSDSMYEIYLSHKDYGVKELMYGLHQKDVEYDDVLEIISATIDDFIDSFIEDHFD